MCTLFWRKGIYIKEIFLDWSWWHIKFTKIVKKEYEDYDGKVYDLCVQDCHSYNIENLVVHNSGAGSLVNYALGITKINPLEYDLLFERFLNKERGHIPKQHWVSKVNFAKRCA